MDLFGKKEIKELRELLENEIKYKNQFEQLATMYKEQLEKEKPFTYTRIPVYDQNDDKYIEYIGKLLEDDRFKFFLEDTMHDLIVVMQKINPGDAESKEKRERAAYRMDGIQFLINKIAEIRGKYFILLNQKTEKE